MDTPTGELAALIPDSRGETLGGTTPSTAVILQRVLQRKGAQVPVAAFQSSI